MAITPLTIPQLLASSSDELQRTGAVSTWHRQGIYAALGDTNTRVAIAPKDFLLDPIPPLLEDAHILSFNWDVPFWAAEAAYPNRRAFWTWWLEEAIPAVLAAYPAPEHSSTG